ncbi:hypothetical protein TSUD_365650 [Trifolium subterraneum]|uniref:Uncharacterized protein n=1 Tax=Trifolium subterraneum TaxID=3900 RepID=A0A2Z6NW96_TRISU|nr:hypothetical protein TSUD_365650 [Trifolium subterraneum]
MASQSRFASQSRSLIRITSLSRINSLNCISIIALSKSLCRNRFVNRSSSLLPQDLKIIEAGYQSIRDTYTGVVVTTRVINWFLEGSKIEW